MLRRNRKRSSSVMLVSFAGISSGVRSEPCRTLCAPSTNWTPELMPPKTHITPATPLLRRVDAVRTWGRAGLAKKTVHPVSPGRRQSGRIRNKEKNDLNTKAFAQPSIGPSSAKNATATPDGPRPLVTPASIAMMRAADIRTFVLSYFRTFVLSYVRTNVRMSTVAP
jgi:hypothetical protein